MKKWSSDLRSPHEDQTRLLGSDTVLCEDDGYNAFAVCPACARDGKIAYYLETFPGSNVFVHDRLDPFVQAVMETTQTMA